MGQRSFHEASAEQFFNPCAQRGISRMIRTLLVFLIGAACTALVFTTYAIPNVRENWRAQGFHEGQISARWEISERLRNEFPTKQQNCKDERKLFEVKTTTVYVLDCETGKQINVFR